MFGSTHLLCDGAAVLAEHDALKATAARDVARMDTPVAKVPARWLARSGGRSEPVGTDRRVH
jgi:hypothetical protein